MTSIKSMAPYTIKYYIGGTSDVIKQLEVATGVEQYGWVRSWGMPEADVVFYPVISAAEAIAMAQQDFYTYEEWCEQNGKEVRELEYIQLGADIWGNCRNVSPHITMDKRQELVTMQSVFLRIAELHELKYRGK